MMIMIGTALKMRIRRRKMIRREKYEYFPRDVYQTLYRRRGVICYSNFNFVYLLCSRLMEYFERYEAIKKSYE